MALSAQEVSIILKAQDQASAIIKSVSGDLTKLGNSAKQAGPSWLSMSSAVAAGTTTATAFMGVARGLTSVFMSAASSSADFGQSMADIRSLVPTADFQQFGGQVQALAMRLGKDYPLSAAEAGKAMTLMAQKGISLEQMLNGGAEAVVKLTSATGADLVTSAGIAANALDTFGVSAEDMGNVTNLMVGAMTRGGVSATDYGFAMAAAGSVIKLAGGDVEDFSIAVAAMAKAGIEGSDAGTSLKSMYMNLIPTTKGAISVARELGILTKDGSNQFFDAAGNVKSYEEISAVLAESLKGLTKEQQLARLETLFGSDAIRAAAVAAKLGAGEYGNLGEQIREVNAGDVAAKRMDSLKGSIEQFKGSAETAALTLMTGLSPGLKEVVDRATELINTAMPYLEEFGAKIGTAFSEGITKAKDLFRQLWDAWGTVKQVFAGEWAPDASIEPLAQAAGRAALKVDEAAGKVGKFIALLAGVNVSGAVTGLDKLSLSIKGVGTASATASTGGMKDFLAIVSNIGEILKTVNLWFQGPIGWLMEWGQSANAAARETSPLTNALLGLLAAGNRFTTFVAAVVEGMALMVSNSLKTTSAMISFGQAMVAVWRGDTEAAQQHARDGAAALQSLSRDTDAYWANTLKRSTDNGTALGRTNEQTYAAISSLTREQLAGMLRTNQVYYDEAGQLTLRGTGEMTDIVTNATQQQINRLLRGGQEQMAAVQTSGGGMIRASAEAMQGVVAAVDAGVPEAVAAAQAAGDGMTTALETGTAPMEQIAQVAAMRIPTAIEGQTPFAVGAADAMGTGVVGALEAAAPAMAAAAESGATQAVAAVQGQSGAANAAGTSVGQNLGQGMVAGILSKVGAVISAARQMVASALSAGNDEGQIESPSKKTMYMGQMLDEGLIKGIESLAPDVKRVMRDLIQSVTDYAPVAGEIARVEREINGIRSQGQTEALFRAQDMITIESELLRLKRDQTDEERRLLPIREDVAAAERAIRDITNGSLSDRSNLLENDTQRKQIRLQTLDLEKQLVGLDRDSKRAEGIQKQIDKLRDQDRLLGIEAERIRLTNDIAATSERRRVLGLGEILTAEERNIQAIGRQIAVLGAEEAVFRANEAIIKNATENEIAYRQRLIAVFNAEGKPLQDRMTAGLALVNQLEAEGKISKELADQLRAIGKEAGVSTTATAAMGNAAATAAPQIDAAAKKAKEMADQAGRIADEAKDAGKEVNALANMLGKLPSWFTPKSSGGGGTSKSVLFGDSVGTTSTSRDVASLVQPVALAGVGAAPGGSGAATLNPTFKVYIGTREMTDWWVETRERVERQGR